MLGEPALARECSLEDFAFAARLMSADIAGTRRTG
jgi:hypothetical protein